jgi:hypothetical protein
MKSAEQLALEHAISLCKSHAEALQDALDDLGAGAVDLSMLCALDKSQRRILDQFAYRYTRLQDDMGMKLFPAVLRALGENVPVMSMIDRLNRLEQLGWIDSAQAWGEHRRIRNEFTHDYPEGADERKQRVILALSSARHIVGLFEQVAARAALGPAQ